MNRSPYCVGVLVIACALFTGCASSTDSYMKSQGATYVPYSISKAGDVPTGGTAVVGGKEAKSTSSQTSSLGWVTLRGFRANGKLDRKGADDEAVLYVSADVSPLIKDPTLIHNDKERDMLMDLLIMISNRNCTKFLGRMHASNANIKAGKGIFQTVFSTATAGTVPFFAPAATGLAVTDVFVSGAATQYENVYLQGKGTEALEAAIIDARQTILAEIIGHKKDSLEVYSVFQLLDDIREYDAAASLRVAARHLQKTQEAAAEDSKDEVKDAKEKAAGKTGGDKTNGGNKGSPKPGASPGTSPTPKASTTATPQSTATPPDSPAPN